MECISRSSEWSSDCRESDCILVTGGTGLIGSSVREILSSTDPCDSEFCIRPKEKWIFLSSSDCDLRDLDNVKILFAKYKPTIVLHLAAKVGGLYTNIVKNLEFFRDNILINDNVLNTAYEAGVKKVVSCLSTCIFSEKATYPLDETKVTNGPTHPHEFNFGCSYAKRMIDVHNRAYNHKLKAQEREGLFTSIIPCNIFGPWDNFDLTESHVIPGLIHKMYLANQRGDSEYTIFGTGSALRQFIYSKDLAMLTIGIVRSYTDPEPIILSVDESDEVPIRALAEMITSCFPNIKSIQTDPSFADGQYKKTVKNNKLRLIFPNFKFTPLPQAIQETVDWFVKNYGVESRLRLGKMGNLAVLFLNAHYNYLRGNISKAAAMLGSMSLNNNHLLTPGDNIAMIIQNNMGCCHFALGKPTIAALNFQKASEESNITEHSRTSFPIQCLSFNKKYEIMYNFGVSLLHAKHTYDAFNALSRCRVAFPSNPRLWLRIAECCVQLYKTSNEDEFTWTEEKRNILRGVENPVPLRKLECLSKEVIDPDKPKPSLYFAHKCIETALYLINSESVLQLNCLDVKPSNPITNAVEIALLRANILALGAFISLQLGHYPYAIQLSNELIEIQNVPNIFTYLGKMYLSEALFKHGGGELSLETFTEKFIGSFKLNLTMANEIERPFGSRSEDLEGDNNAPRSSTPKQKLNPLGSLAASKTAAEWIPRDELTARATVIYNRAVAFTALNRFKEGSDVIDDWNLRMSSTGHSLFADFIILQIYLNLKLGNIEKSSRLFRQYYHCPLLQSTNSVLHS